jgi:two-component system chemotaxis response regulator CheY
MPCWVGSSQPRLLLTVNPQEARVTGSSVEFLSAAAILFSTMSQLSILVADDAAEICQLLRQWLEAVGHRVDTAGTGTEAMKLLRRQSYDLVIADVLMPDGDGLDLIEASKQTSPAARIMAISGGGRYLDQDLCLKFARGYGAHAAIAKPFKREQLLAEVASVVG